MPEPIVYLAVDVAKATLDPFCCDQHYPTMANTLEALAQLVSQVQKGHPHRKLHLVCEASGGYERKVVEFAMSNRLLVSVVSPSRVRNYAKACNQLAKTDRIDAEMIARFAQSVHPRPLQEQEAWGADLQALVMAKLQLKENITRLGNQLENLSHAQLGRCLQRLLRAHEKELKNLDRLMEKLLKQHQDLNQKVSRIESVQGVGKATALGVIALMPELGSLGDNQAAALAGLAPFNRDSGPSKGYRSIRGGRRKVRTLLYMPALTAIRLNPVLKKVYQRLRNNGKKPLVAITAVMRKLIVLFNRLLANPDFSLAS